MIKQVPLRRGWSRVVICASGPSFTPAQAELIVAAQPRWRVIAINTMWEQLPSADVLYVGDSTWWHHYIKDVQRGFKGECWTLDHRCAHDFNLCCIDHSDEEGLCTLPGRIHCGSDSGHAALNLAYHFGAKQILLTGFDYQDTGGMSHSHGDHPKGLGQERPFDKWLRRLPAMIEGLRDAGVWVTNCTTLTAIPESVVQRGDLETCLS